MKKRTTQLALMLAMSTMLMEASLAEQDYQLNINSQMVLRGDYEPSYDLLTGASGQYFFKKSDSWQHYVKAGWLRNLESSANKLDIYSIGVGSQYQFAQLWQKNVFVDYSIAASYHQEEFSTQLIDRTTKSTFSEVDYQLGAGIGMDFTQQFSGQLFINQLGSQGTSAGVELSLKF